jgi:hypothetical protein
MKDFWNKLLGNLSGLFRNGNGPNWSSTRFAFLLSVVLSNFSIFGVWIYLSLLNGQMLPIDDSILMLYAICNGLLSATKLIQKNMEKKKVPSEKKDV